MTNSNMIDQVIDSGAPISAEINGAQLSRSGSRAQTTQISVQVIPEGSGSFEVHLEGSVNTRSGRAFSKIGEWTQSDDVLLSVFPVSQGCNYRLRHVFGFRGVVWI